MANWGLFAQALGAGLQGSFDDHAAAKAKSAQQLVLNQQKQSELDNTATKNRQDYETALLDRLSRIADPETASRIAAVAGFPMSAQPVKGPGGVMLSGALTDIGSTLNTMQRNTDLAANEQGERGLKAIGASHGFSPQVTRNIFATANVPQSWQGASTGDDVPQSQTPQPAGQMPPMPAPDFSAPQLAGPNLTPYALRPLGTSPPLAGVTAPSTLPDGSQGLRVSPQSPVATPVPNLQTTGNKPPFIVSQSLAADIKMLGGDQSDVSIKLGQLPPNDAMKQSAAISHAALMSQLEGKTATEEVPIVRAFNQAHKDNPYAYMYEPGEKLSHGRTMGAYTKDGQEYTIGGKNDFEYAANQSAVKKLPPSPLAGLQSLFGSSQPTTSPAVALPGQSVVTSPANASAPNQSMPQAMNFQSTADANSPFPLSPVESANERQSLASAMASTASATSTLGLLQPTIDEKKAVTQQALSGTRNATLKAYGEFMDGVGTQSHAGQVSRITAWNSDPAQTIKVPVPGTRGFNGAVIPDYTPSTADQAKIALDKSLKSKYDTETKLLVPRFNHDVKTDNRRLDIEGQNAATSAGHLPIDWMNAYTNRGRADTEAATATAKDNSSSIASATKARDEAQRKLALLQTSMEGWATETDDKGVKLHADDNGKITVPMPSTYPENLKKLKTEYGAAQSQLDMLVGGYPGGDAYKQTTHLRNVASNQLGQLSTQLKALRTQNPSSQSVAVLSDKIKKAEMVVSGYDDDLERMNTNDSPAPSQAAVGYQGIAPDGGVVMPLNPTTPGAGFTLRKPSTPQYTMRSKVKKLDFSKFLP